MITIFSRVSVPIIFSSESFSFAISLEMTKFTTIKTLDILIPVISNYYLLYNICLIFWRTNTNPSSVGTPYALNDLIPNDLTFSVRILKEYNFHQ